MSYPTMPETEGGDDAKEETKLEIEPPNNVEEGPEESGKEPKKNQSPKPASSANQTGGTRQTTETQVNMWYIAAAVGCLIIIGLLVAILVFVLQIYQDEDQQRVFEGSTESSAPTRVPDAAPSRVPEVPMETPAPTGAPPTSGILPSTAPTPISLPESIPTDVQVAIRWLLANTDTSLTNFLDQSSPQYRAAEWLATIDEHSQTKFPPNDVIKLRGRYSLVTMALALNATNWINATANECAWERVLCNRQSHVERLRFNDFGLRGELPSEVGLLDDIKELRLDGNSLYGKLDGVELLSTLNWLGLDENEYVGTIPDTIGSLRNLWILGLAKNSFTGTLPTTLTGLPIVNFSVNDNKIQGRIDVLSSMPDLTYVHLHNNQFTGTFEELFIDNLDGIASLNMHNNRFSGAIPQRVLDSRRMNVFSIANNKMAGTIPFGLGAMSGSLRKIDLSQNQLSGQIPPGFNSLWRLKHLDLSGNNLSGPLPVLQQGLWPQIRTLYYGDNPITGSIPPDYFNVSTLEAFSVQNTELTGVLPTLENASSLRLLNVRNSNLMGTLPELSLPRLEILLVNNNNFVGSVPSIASTNITVVRLEGNPDLVGSVPSDLCNQSRLTELVVDCTRVDCECCTSCCPNEGCEEEPQPTYRLGIESDW